ncbi:MAG: hypothetical protein ABIJ56_22145 [Pseudomonadota bacterium]
MKILPVILLVIIFSSLYACSEENGSSDDALVETDGTDGAEDVEIEPPFDGPGCLEIDKDADTIPDDVEGDLDSDGDTIPNFKDEDSDGDTIHDRHEAGDFICSTDPIDTDGDGLPDYLDLDSDNDTLPDSEEAGDDDIDSYPRDTDGWGTPDFRDTDSDNDGLSDRQETGLGLDPHNEDSDGDGWSDIEEIASLSGDPLNPDKTVGEDEDIFILWYKGRSMYQVYTAAAHYFKNDVFFIVDDTTEAAGLFRDEFAAQFLPRMNMSLDGVKTGLGIFSGWEMPGGFHPVPCFYTFYGLAKLTDRAGRLESAAAGIPLCPNPLEGGSVVNALYSVIAQSAGSAWPADEEGCAFDGAIGSACYRSDARRFAVLLVEGDFPEETPEGFPDHHSADEISEILANKGIHLAGLLVQDNLADPPYGKVAGLAAASGGTDRTLRPLVYMTGRSGEALDIAVENAIDDIARSHPADVDIEAVDGADWPEGIDVDMDGDLDNYDATQLVSTIYPRGWSPPPGIAPEEAVSHIDSTTYVRTIPDTEVSYKVYFRNYRLEQGEKGYIFDVTLKLKNQLGYVFAAWPVKIIVPCEPGDVVEEE